MRLYPPNVSPFIYQRRLLEESLNYDISKVLLPRRSIHPPDAIASTTAQPETMVTSALLLTFNAVTAAAVDNAHTASPLAQGVDSDILRRVCRVNPLRVI